MTTNETLQAYHDILVAIAQGKTSQWREYPHQDWQYVDNGTIMAEIATQEYPPWCYRVKPIGIEANGFVIPRPLQVPPTYNSVYWYITPSTNRGYQSATWTDHAADQQRLKNRQIWAAEDEIKTAIQELAALLST
jgi:hypothetical protein